MKIRSFGWALTTMLVLWSISPASAQTTGTITGRITDKDTQAGVAGATVEAVSGGRTVASAVTDADGQYRLNLPAGTYSVVVNMVGYQVERVATVRVLAGETSINAVALTTQAFVLNPLVVSASKHVEKLVEAPAAISVVPEREIAERPTTTPVEHLRNVPGVDIMTTGVQGSNVVVRGFNNIFSGALHVLTDYRIAGVPSLRVNFLQFIPQNSDDFSRMEVVMGPGSALYGPNTANGVLHIITKSPLDDQGTTLSGSFGTYPGATPTTGLTPGAPASPVPTCNTLSCPGGGMFQGTFRTAQKLSDRFGFKVSAQYQKADEFFYRDHGEDSIASLVKTGLAANSAPALRATGLFPTTSTDADVIARAGRIANRDFDLKRWAGDARADWRPTDKFSAVFSGGMTNDNSIELTGIGAAQAVDWKYQYGQVRANYGSWFAQTYINKSDAGDTYLLRNGAPIHDQSRVWVSQLQNVTRIGGRQTFTYGADYISTNPITNGTINGAREDDDNYTEFGAYVQSETKLAKLFDLVLAGRGDKHSRLDDWVFSPRAGVVFKPNENHNFRVTYNKAFSTPTSLNLFLDIDAGALGALGPFGFRAHAQAPGREGINLHAADGSIQIRSPFSSNAAAVSQAQYLSDPTTLQAVSLASIFERQISALGLANAGVGGNAALIGYMRSLPTTDAAAFAAANSLITLDPLTKRALPFSAGVADVGGIKESTSSTFEVGYKGIIGDRLLLAADAWFSKHKNFTSPLITATPFVMLNPQQLVPYLVSKIAPLVGGVATATAIATGMAQLPGGIVSSNGTTVPGPNLILTYINFGDISLSGQDVSATALLSPKFQWSISGSLVSDDYFKLPLGTATNDSTVVALNAPKGKATTALTYRDAQSGLNAELRLRYQGEFPANSAGYVGLKCVDPTAAGDCVKAYTLFDISAGYRLPVTGASVQLAITNLTDQKYQSFIGTPAIRRMAILRLRYELK